MRQIWNSLGGISKIEVIKTDAWRIVEDQTRSSTRKMVNTVPEHELLEEMIEGIKPKLKFYGDEDSFLELHYLLSTPFRYPPLKTGTRFGLRTQRNLFYSSLDIETALCEKAYRRLNFFIASKGNIGGKSVNCTAFKVNVATNKGIDLSKPPFNEFHNRISSPVSYNDSQTLGTCMREDGVEAFISFSARNKNGKNLNVFTPCAFGKNESLEKTFKNFSCYSTKSVVEFYSNLTSIDSPIVFKIESFYVNNIFPICHS